MASRRKRRNIQKDFLEALERLKNGKPKHPALLESARKGILTINPLSVSMEARRSRTLIGSEECRYPNIRELVLQAGPRSNRTVLKSDVVTKLRETVHVLQEELATARTLLASQRITIDALSRTLP